MNFTSKNKIFLGIAVLVLIIGGLFLFRGGDDEAEDNMAQENQSLDLREGEIMVEGEITCLPYNINVEGQSCVKGLKGDDDKVYALNSIEVSGIENTMDEGEDVVAIGTFEPANTNVDEASVFSYDGVLVLRVLQKQ